MVWSANCYRELARRFVVVRGMMCVELACQDLKLAPMLINDMVHDGKPRAIPWIARYLCLVEDCDGTVTVVVTLVVMLVELWGKQRSLAPPQGRP